MSKPSTRQLRERRHRRVRGKIRGTAERPRLAVFRSNRGIFAQLVVVPLFAEHHILSQVAGHNINVVKGLPPLTIGEDDIEWFVSALERVLVDAQKLGRAATKFALSAARAGR